MAKYEERPRIVEAVQWWPGIAIEGLIGGHTSITFSNGVTIDSTLLLNLDGTSITVNAGDWVLTNRNGVKGVCPNDLFQEVYRLVVE